MNEIDLTSLLRLCWRNLKWLVLGLAVGTVLLFSLSSFVMTPTYQSSSDLFVTSLTNFVENSITQAALVTSQQLAYTYAEVLKNDVALVKVADGVNAQLGTDLTAKQVRSMIAFSIPEDTLVLRVTCVSKDPQVAEQVCNVLCQVAPETLREICGVGKSKQVGQASKATKAEPNVPLYTILGGMAGFVLVLAVVVIRWMTDNTIKGREDLSERTPIPVLAEIPAFEDGRRAESRRQNAGKVRVVRGGVPEAKEDQ